MTCSRVHPIVGLRFSHNLSVLLRFQEDDQVMIPEPIFSLLNVLPKTAQGPIIPVDDLIRILLDSPIQAPLIPARMVPIAIDKNKKRKWDEGQ